MLDSTLELQKLDQIEQIIRDVLLEHSEHILALVKLQMEKGIDGEGQPVTLYGNPEYHPRTIKEKQQFGYGLGAETQWVTNYMSGEFYDSLYIEPTPDGSFHILSSDPKADKIITRSGAQILQLNNTSREFLMNDFIIPEVAARIEAIYGIR